MSKMKCGVSGTELCPENCSKCQAKLKNGSYCKEIRSMMWLNLKAKYAGFRR